MWAVRKGTDGIGWHVDAVKMVSKISVAKIGGTQTYTKPGMIVYVVSMEPPCSSANFLALCWVLGQLVTSPGKRDIRFNVVLGLADNLEVPMSLKPSTERSCFHQVQLTMCLTFSPAILKLSVEI